MMNEKKEAPWMKMTLMAMVAWVALMMSNLVEANTPAPLILDKTHLQNTKKIEISYPALVKLWHDSTSDATSDLDEGFLRVLEYLREDLIEDLKNDYRDFKSCFDYSQFSHPERIDYDLLEGICEFMKIQNLKYVHHSDWRKSTHQAGMALDFSFKVPPGEDPDMFHRKIFMALEYYLLETGRTDWGVGLYVKTPPKRNFFHVDIGWNANGPMIPGRRWGRDEQGNKISIGKALDLLIRRSRQHL